jgi:hypothetical protein
MLFSLNCLKFEDVREQIILYLTANSPYAGQFDFRSGNLSYFIDTMAYVAMNMNFNIANIANNRFLDTTEIRKNGVSRAREIGYTPNRPYSAKFSGNLIYNGTNFGPGNSLTIYPRSPFGGSFGNTYLNMEPIVLSYNGNPTQLEGGYTLSEGVFQYYQMPTSGQMNSSFTINNPNIDAENFSLFVIPLTIANNPLNGLIDSPYQLGNFLQFKWSVVKTFNEMVESNIYYLEEDTVNEGYPRIVFGNGLIGSIPLDTDAIYCESFQVKGASANNENLISLPPMDAIAGTDQVYTFYGTGDMGIENKSNFSINNFDTSYQNPYNKSFGGSDLESLESIKASAPKYYSSVGRAATRNDYVYILKSFPGVGSVNVVGGPDLYPNDLTQLGNIYACVVPNIDLSNFIYNNNIYLSDAMTNDIANRLETYAIISTKRHFYKPSYILIDVTPNIELTGTVTTTEQNKIKTQVQNIITNYFNTTYNDLGIPFRESKVSSTIDGLNYISSSSVDLTFAFVINNNTVANLVDGVNNILYLPTQNVKDTSGNIVGTKNFIKTNDEVVKELNSNVGWAILDKNFDDLVALDDVAGQTLYLATLKLLNTYQSYMLPSECSVYSAGGLINDTMNRYIYNSDFTTVKIVDFWYINGMTTLYSTPYTYQDKLKRTVVAKINNASDASGVKSLVFTLIDEFGISREHEVATIIESPDMPTAYDVELSMSSTGPLNNITNLCGYFGIDESQFIYNGYANTPSPFHIVQLSPTRFSVEMRVNSYISELVMSGENDLFNVAVDQGSRTLTPVAISSTQSMWNVPAQLRDLAGALTPFAPITMTMDGSVPTTVGYIEMSHFYLGLANSANEPKFQGFIGSAANQWQYAGVAATMQNELANSLPHTFHKGDYFIVTDFTYVPDVEHPENDVYYKPNDVLFVAGNGDISGSYTLAQSPVKRTISSSKPGELNTTFNQGDLFIIDPAATPKEYMVYDELTPTYNLDGILKNYSDVVLEPYTGLDTTSIALDPTQSLPLPLGEDTLVEILLSDDLNGGMTGTGIAINFPQTYHDKIGNLYHRIVIGGVDAYHRTVIGGVDAWTDMGTTKVKDGDLLLYADGKWRLIENTDRNLPAPYDASMLYVFDQVVTGSNGTVYICILAVTGYDPVTSPTYWTPFVDRIVIGAENASDVSSLSQGLYNVYRITSDIVLSTGPDLTMFDNPPSDNMLTTGDYIVCITPDLTGVTRGIWKVYNGNIFQFQIDANNSNSTFPFQIAVGDIFTVKVPLSLAPSATLNFHGGTNTTTYIDGSLIMYAGVDDLGISIWKPIVLANITSLFEPTVDAVIGDIILISDVDGNLGNNTSKLDVPQMAGMDMMFNYNDILYYTGISWIKARPINAYNVPNQPALRSLINAAGFNSDIMVRQTTTSSCVIYMLDKFHNVVIGDLDYYTGVLTLSTTIDQTLNKTTTITGQSTLSDIFKSENYLNSAMQMDAITMTPNQINNTIDGNFDTNFNQYIVANVKDVQITT